MRLWRNDGMMPTRKSRISQRKTFFKATLSISNPTNWPGKITKEQVGKEQQFSFIRNTENCWLFILPTFSYFLNTDNIFTAVEWIINS
jgi:hypothetical protein